LARWHVFHEFLEKAVAQGDVWFAPMEEIAAYARAEIDGGRYKAMVELIPQYDRPVGRVFQR
jgi:peptidoglycan-N-acetylglucosamine deacetylase